MLDVNYLLRFGVGFVAQFCQVRRQCTSLLRCGRRAFMRFCLLWRLFLLGIAGLGALIKSLFGWRPAHENNIMQSAQTCKVTGFIMKISNSQFPKRQGIFRQLRRRHQVEGGNILRRGFGWGCHEILRHGF